VVLSSCVTCWIECGAVIVCDVLDRMWCCYSVTCWIECGAVTV